MVEKVYGVEYFSFIRVVGGGVGYVVVGKVIDGGEWKEKVGMCRFIRIRVWKRVVLIIIKEMRCFDS